MDAGQGRSHMCEARRSFAMKVRTNTFDSVAMKRRGAEHVMKLIAGMTPEEELAFWRRETEDARREQAEIVARSGEEGGAATDKGESG